MKLFDEIQGAIEAGLRLLPLQVALTIPDICGALEYKNNQANRSRYISWYGQWMEAKYTWDADNPTTKQALSGKIDLLKTPFELRGNKLIVFSAVECYQFRCALLHQGKTNHKNSKFRNIVYILSLDGTEEAVIHNSVASDVDGNHALYIDVPKFCVDMVGSGRAWLDAKKNNVIVKKNLESAIRQGKATTPFGVGEILA